MVDKPPLDPAPIVIAYQWAARIISLALTMVVPGLIGVYADRRFGTKVLFTLLGFAVGMSYAGLQMIKLTASLKEASLKKSAALKQQEKPEGDDSEPVRRRGGS